MWEGELGEVNDELERLGVEGISPGEAIVSARVGVEGILVGGVGVSVGMWEGGVGGGK